MGLENLKSVFNNLSENQINDIPKQAGSRDHKPAAPRIIPSKPLGNILKHSTIDPKSGLHSPISDLSEDFDSFKQTPFPKIDSVFANKSIQLKTGQSLIEDSEHTFGTQGRNKDLIEIGFLEKRQYPSPLSQGGDEPPSNIEFPIHYSKEPPYGGQNLLPQLGYSQNEDATQNNPTATSISKRQKRSDDIFQNLGQNNNLGEGEFILDNLYNHNHTARFDRPTEVPYGQTTINFNRAGIGSLANLDIKGYSGGFRKGSSASILGYGDGREPYIVNPIPKTKQEASGIGNALIQIGSNRDIFPWYQLAQDTSRLLRFYTSSAGVAFYAKEVLTSAATGFGITRPVSLISDLPELIKSPIVVGRSFSAHPIIINAPSIKATTAITVAQQAENSRIFAGQFTAPPVPMPMVGFLNFYHTSLQQPGSINLRKPLARGVEYSSLVKVGALQSSEGFSKIAFLGELQQEMHTRFTFEDPVLNKYFTPLPKDPKNAKYEPVEYVIPLKDEKSTKTNFSSIKKSVKKPAFLGLGLRKPEDIISSKYLLGTKKEGKLLDKPPLENFNAEKLSGDFYVRIKDVRSNRFTYFRGFVTGITENVSPSFTPTNYIGRSEPVYQYERTERDLSFNLRVYPANNTEFKRMYTRIERLTGLAYPEYLQDTDNLSLTRMQPPFTELYMAHIGTKTKGQFGFIKSLSYTVNDSGDWDSENSLPRLFDIAISYQILSKRSPSSSNGSLPSGKFYGEVA